MWDEKEIEVVRSFEYLGYAMKENGKEEGQIRKLKEKANTVMSTIWGIGESLFRDSWCLRMRLFDTLVKSVMEYGAELWGWKERKDLENIQRKYMKWVLKLDATTPGHILHLETKRRILETKTRRRAMKYEEKLCKPEEGTLWRECWRILEKEGREGANTARRTGTRETEVNKCGWSLAEYHRKLVEGEQVWQELERVSKDIQWQEWNREVRGSKQARDTKLLVRDKKGLAVTARLRLGNEARGYRYWMSEEERKCRLCEESEETLEHFFEKCKITGDAKVKWEEVLNGERKNFSKLVNVKWNSILRH